MESIKKALEILQARDENKFTEMNQCFKTIHSILKDMIENGNINYDSLEEIITFLLKGIQDEAVFEMLCNYSNRKDLNINDYIIKILMYLVEITRHPPQEFRYLFILQ